LNAAINLRTAASSAVAACGADGSGDGHQIVAKPAVQKQEEKCGMDFRNHQNGA